MPLYSSFRTRFIQSSICLFCTISPTTPSVVSLTRRYASKVAVGEKRIRSKKPTSKRTVVQMDPMMAAAGSEIENTEDRNIKQNSQSILRKTSKFIADASININESPTLADLDKLEPPHNPTFDLNFIYPDPSHMPLKMKAPNDTTVQAYTDSHAKLVDKLISRFSRTQLQALLKLCKKTSTLDTRFRRMPYQTYQKSNTVRALAAAIIRWRWSWPLVQEVLERQRYLIETSEKGFLLTPSELFLLLGTDGSTLRELCEKHGVVLKDVKRSKAGFRLVLDGLSHSLDALTVVLAMLNERIRTDVVELKKTHSDATEKWTIRADLLPRISKLTGALVEDLGDGKFRISAYDPNHISTAKRLLIRASQQASLTPPALMAFFPSHSQQSSYALFPFELSRPEKSPFYWSVVHMLTSVSDTYSTDHTGVTDLAKQSLPSQSVYRAQKVSNWLNRSSDHNLISSSKFGAEGQFIELSGKSYTLRQALGLSELSQESQESLPLRSRPVTALFGHIVFSPSSGVEKELLPNLQDSSQLPSLFEWIKSSAKVMTFIPELPASSTNLSPIHSTLLTRLVYRSITPSEMIGGAVKTLKFEFTSPNGSRLKDRLDLSADLYRADLERGLFAHEALMTDLPDVGIGPEMPFSQLQDTPSIPFSQLVRITEGDERSVNIMLPDRPMDIQFNVFDCKIIDIHAAPELLRDYAAKLLKWKDWSEQNLRPIPPLQIKLEGKSYVLDWDATVKSSFHIAVDDSTSDPMAAVIDSMRDYETKEYLKTYSLSCSNCNIDTEWDKFLTHCDDISFSKNSRTSPSYPTSTSHRTHINEH